VVDATSLVTQKSSGPPDHNSDSNTIGKHLQVFVRDNNAEQALKVLKKKMQREGVFREMKHRKAYEKTSLRARKQKPSDACGKPPGNRLSATV
jgi:ribosomal protein S21